MANTQLHCPECGNGNAYAEYVKTDVTIPDVVRVIVSVWFGCGHAWLRVLEADRVTHSAIEHWDRQEDRI